MKRFPISLLVCTFAANFAAADEPGTKQTIAYLQKLQSGSGAFRANLPKKSGEEVRPTLGATSSSVRALHHFGGEVPNKDECVKFVDSCFDPKTGGFSQMPGGKTDVHATAVGLMAVVELKMPTEKYAEGASKYLSENAKTFEDIRIAVAGFEAIKKQPANADKWMAEVRSGQNKDATFGEAQGQARDTGSRVVALLRLNAKPSSTDAILSTIKAGQRQNGGWGKAESAIGSDLETSYRVMRCFAMLKARPDNIEGIRSFVAKCRNADGGYGVAPGQASSASGTYFAGSVLHWLKD